MKIGCTQKSVSLCFLRLSPLRAINVSDHGVGIFDPSITFEPIPANSIKISIVKLGIGSDLLIDVLSRAGFIGSTFHCHIGKYFLRDNGCTIAKVLIPKISFAGSKR